MPSDSTLTCQDCGQPFVFTVREQEYYASRGFDNPPGRCPDCRAARKAERGGERSSGNRAAREMFSATCASCGKEAQVPFQPSGDRPVYCSQCYQEHRGSPPRSRSHGVRATEDAAALDAPDVVAGSLEPTIPRNLRD